MYKGKKIVVVMPAFNAAKTLKRTYDEIDFNLVDSTILVDDMSTDNTIQLANELGIDHILQHEVNKGYGANQKTCYKEALRLNADIIVLLHPDYQYDPKLIAMLVSKVVDDNNLMAVASRMLNGGALNGGMPIYKWISNKALTWIQNKINKTKLSEYHTGYRAFQGEVLSQLDLSHNSDSFIFDNEILSQAIYAGYSVGEISCQAHYSSDSSSINLWSSLVYGFGVLRVCLQHFLQTNGVINMKRYRSNKL